MWSTLGKWGTSAYGWAGRTGMSGLTGAGRGTNWMATGLGTTGVGAIGGGVLGGGAAALGGGDLGDVLGGAALGAGLGAGGARYGMPMGTVLGGAMSKNMGLGFSARAAGRYGGGMMRRDAVSLYGRGTTLASNAGNYFQAMGKAFNKGYRG